MDAIIQPNVFSASKSKSHEDLGALTALISSCAEPLPEPDDPSFGLLFDRFANNRIVLLGEASHGTSEFYKARAAISEHLIKHHGFSFVAAEADWPDAFAFNRYVRHMPPPKQRPPPIFRRFPTWMWRNTDVQAFVHWLHDWNASLEPAKRAGFYGLDLYNMSASIASVLAYLDEVDPVAAKTARERYECLAPWSEDPQTYGMAVLMHGGVPICKTEVVRQCRELFENAREYSRLNDGPEGFLDAIQNARLVMDAERYYRMMFYEEDNSWNLRDTHMFGTLKMLMDVHGPNSKGIVWAHNSHIGDARSTSMSKPPRNELNIGQLCREHYGDENVALIGFGTHTGTVSAASNWDGDMEVKQIVPSQRGSIERLCHDTGLRRFILDLQQQQNGDGNKETLRKRLMSSTHLERFIGVIYRPKTEMASHYSKVQLPGQFNAYVWFDETKAVTPLGKEHALPGAPETYPFGL